VLECQSLAVNPKLPLSLSKRWIGADQLCKLALEAARRSIAEAASPGTG